MNLRAFEVGQTVMHLWDEDLVLLLRRMSPSESIAYGFIGGSIERGVFVCWQALSLTSGLERVIIDADLDPDS